MKVVRAMKKVARLQGEIKDIKHRISSTLSTVKENDFDEKYEELTTTLKEKVESLISLKNKIMKTNIENDMFSVILELGELKSRIDFLRDLSPRVGTEVNDYHNTKTDYKSQMTIKERIELIDKCQEDINKQTDALDDFNAKTDLVK